MEDQKGDRNHLDKKIKIKNRYKKSDFRKDSFMETLHALDKMRKTSNAVLTKEEVAAYFKDMHLSEQQRELVYEYLQRPMEQSGDTAPSPSGRFVSLTAEQEAVEGVKLQDSVFFQMYRKDLQKIIPCTTKEEEALYDRLIAGDAIAVQKLSEQWMRKVLELAQTQIISADPKEMADIVQEGNMGVFLALQQLLGSGKKTDFEKELSEAAMDAMEKYMKKIIADSDMDQSLLAKAALVYEAQKYLAEQLQRLPSPAELSQYTKLAESELEDILAILEEKK